MKQISWNTPKRTSNKLPCKWMGENLITFWSTTEVFFLTQNPIEQNNSAQFYRFWIALDMQVFYFFNSLERSTNKIKCITNTNLCVTDEKFMCWKMKIYVLQREETVHTKCKWWHDVGRSIEMSKPRRRRRRRKGSQWIWTKWKEKMSWDCTKVDSIHKPNRGKLYKRI